MHFKVIAKIVRFQPAITLRLYGVNSCFKVLLRRPNVPESADVVEFKFPCKKI